MNKYRRLLGAGIWLAAAIVGTMGLQSVVAEDAATQPASQPAGKLAIGQAAPEIAATDFSGKNVTLTDFRGKPVVLQFGSITEPVFRMHAAAVEKLAETLGDKAAFIVIYQRESHAADTDAALSINQQEMFNIAQPVNEQERLKLAKECAERLGLKHQKVLVDAWNDASSRAYGGYPNMTFVIDAQGRLATGSPWMDTKKVQGALDAVLAGKPVPAEFSGPTRSGSIPALSASDGAKEMMGAPNRLGLVIALDRMKLNEKQKAVIYPVLTQYIADLKQFREMRQAGDKQGGVASEELKTRLEGLRTSAEKVKAAFREVLSEADAKAAIDAMERTPAARRMEMP